MSEKWIAGTKGFTTSTGDSYSLARVGNREPGPEEIENLAKWIVDAVNLVDGPAPVDDSTWWLSAYSAARNALRHYEAALLEFDKRTKRALAHMQDTGAVLGEAAAFVGFGAASADVKDARTVFDTAVRELLGELAKGIRP